MNILLTRMENQFFNRCSLHPQRGGQLNLESLLIKLKVVKTLIKKIFNK